MAAAPQTETAAVVVDGRALWRMRGVSALPAAERVRAIADRITAVAANESIPVDSVRAVDAGDRTNILAGDSRLLSITDADTALEQLDDRKLLAEIYVTDIQQAITQYRYERSGAFLTKQLLHAAVALVIVGTLLLGSWHLLRRVENSLEERFTRKMEELEARSFNLLTAEQLLATGENLLRGIRMLLAFVLAFAGLDYVLSLFPWTRPIAREITVLVIEPLQTMGDAILDAIPGLVFILILIAVTRYGLRLIQLFFAGIGTGRIRFKEFSPEWAWPTYRLVRIGVIAFAVVIAYPYIPGSSSDAFKGVSLFLGLLMSLGAASAVANSLAGYTLIYRRAFRVGDRIRVGDLVGDVTEMRQQVTHLRTTKNEEVTIPSSMLLNSHVVNYSTLARTDGLILHTSVGIGYETPWRQVEAMLKLAAERTPGLKKTPAPFVSPKLLGDFGVTYELNAYCETANKMEATYAAMHRNILDVFNEFNVAIMTPAYVADPEVPKVVPKDQWYLAPAEPPSAKPT